MIDMLTVAQIVTAHPTASEHRQAILELLQRELDRRSTLTPRPTISGPANHYRSVRLVVAAVPFALLGPSILRRTKFFTPRHNIRTREVPRRIHVPPHRRRIRRTTLIAPATMPRIRCPAMNQFTVRCARHAPLVPRLASRERRATQIHRLTANRARNTTLSIPLPISAPLRAELLHPGRFDTYAALRARSDHTLNRRVPPLPAWAALETLRTWTPAPRLHPLKQATTRLTGTL